MKSLKYGIVILYEEVSIIQNIDIAQDVAKKLIESYIEHGDTLPFEIKAKKDFAITTTVPVSINA
jgi:hypothetical protein